MFGMDEHPSLLEVEEAIRTLKNREASEPDRFPGELFKLSGEELTQLILGAYLTCWRNGEVARKQSTKGREEDQNVKSIEVFVY